MCMKKEENTKQEKKENVKGRKSARNEKRDQIEKTKVEETPLEDANVQEIIVEKNKGFNFLEVILIMIITFLFGGLAGGFIVYTAKNNPIISNGDTSIPSELSEFYSVYNALKEGYYDSNLDAKGLLDAGIQGMIDYLGDPYSNYIDNTATDSFDQKLNGEYVGIGAEITKYKDGRAEISKVLENTPAAEAGLVVGDQVLSIDGQMIANMSVNEISKLIQGDENTSVTLGLTRGEEELTVTVIRKKIEISSVSSELISTGNQKVGYFKIDIFALNTFNQFESQLLELQTQGMTSVVIDVRDNSGGHLKVAEQIASLFVPKGKIIYQLETDGVKEAIYSSRSANFNLPVVVLMNEDSASASEILAAALKESYGATLVGGISYGKGTVQTTMHLSSGAVIKYTIQRWLTPSGECVEGIGIVPDYPITQEDAYYENPSMENDTQLQKALSILQDIKEESEVQE